MAPVLSSIPTQTPDMQKTEKKKAGTDSSVKKRKREEEEQDNAKETVEPSAKKPKEWKSESAAVATPAAMQNGASSTASPTPKDKSQKKKKRKASEDPVTSGPSEGPSVKKSKKSKKDQRGASQEAVDDAQSTSPADVPPVNQKKKLKKNRQSARSGEAVADDKVVASSSKSQQTVHASRQESREPSTAISDKQRLESHSPFLHQTETFYLALSPCANNFPLKGLIAEHISPLLLTYYPPLGGVVMKYSSARLSEHPDDMEGNQKDSVVLSKAIDEYAVTFVYLTVDLALFRPSKGTYLEGYVNLQNESLLGLVCYNYFNAGIERQRLPNDWRWVEDESQGNARMGKGGHGFWVDGSGEKIDGRVVFRVKDFEATPGSESGTGSINIIGTLLSAGEDWKVDEENLLVGGR